MGQDAAHHQGRRKGMTLLRALFATFRHHVASSALLVLGDSTVHVTQVRYGAEFFLLASSKVQRSIQEVRVLRPLPPFCLVGENADVLRSDIVGTGGSIVIRLRPFMILSTSLTPPSSLRELTQFVFQSNLLRGAPTFSLKTSMLWLLRWVDSDRRGVSNTQR